MIRSGQIDVEPNLDYYILKFGDKARSTAELEQTYYEMALADAIIRDVVASLKQFRTIATKYGVSDEWTGRVETTIVDHLKAWGEWKEDE